MATAVSSLPSSASVVAGGGGDRNVSFAATTSDKDRHAALDHEFDAAIKKARDTGGNVPASSQMFPGLKDESSTTAVSELSNGVEETKMQIVTLFEKASDFQWKMVQDILKIENDGNLQPLMTMHGAADLQYARIDMKDIQSQIDEILHQFTEAVHHYVIELDKYTKYSDRQMAELRSKISNQDVHVAAMKDKYDHCLERMRKNDLQMDFLRGQLVRREVTLQENRENYLKEIAIYKELLFKKGAGGERAAEIPDQPHVDMLGSLQDRQETNLATQLAAAMEQRLANKDKPQASVARRKSEAHWKSTFESMKRQYENERKILETQFEKMLRDKDDTIQHMEADFLARESQFQKELEQVSANQNEALEAATFELQEEINQMQQDFSQEKQNLLAIQEEALANMQLQYEKEMQAIKEESEANQQKLHEQIETLASELTHKMTMIDDLDNQLGNALQQNKTVSEMVAKQAAVAAEGQSDIEHKLKIMEQQMAEKDAQVDHARAGLDRLLMSRENALGLYARAYRQLENIRRNGGDLGSSGGKGGHKAGGAAGGKKHGGGGGHGKDSAHHKKELKEKDDQIAKLRQELASAHSQLAASQDHDVGPGGSRPASARSSKSSKSGAAGSRPVSAASRKSGLAMSSSSRGHSPDPLSMSAPATTVGSDADALSHAGFTLPTEHKDCQTPEEWLSSYADFIAAQKIAAAGGAGGAGGAQLAGLAAAPPVRAARVAVARRAPSPGLSDADAAQDEDAAKAAAAGGDSEMGLTTGTEMARGLEVLKGAMAEADELRAQRAIARWELLYKHMLTRMMQENRENMLGLGGAGGVGAEGGADQGPFPNEHDRYGPAGSEDLETDEELRMRISQLQVYDRLEARAQYRVGRMRNRLAILELERRKNIEKVMNAARLLVNPGEVFAQDMRRVQSPRSDRSASPRRTSPPSRYSRSPTPTDSRYGAFGSLNMPRGGGAARPVSAGPRFQTTGKTKRQKSARGKRTVFRVHAGGVTKQTETVPRPPSSMRSESPAPHPPARPKTAPGRDQDASGARVPKLALPVQGHQGQYEYDYDEYDRPHTAHPAPDAGSTALMRIQSMGGARSARGPSPGPGGDRRAKTARQRAKENQLSEIMRRSNRPPSSGGMGSATFREPGRGASGQGGKINLANLSSSERRDMILKMIYQDQRRSQIMKNRGGNPSRGGGGGPGATTPRAGGSRSRNSRGGGGFAGQGQSAASPFGGMSTTTPRRSTPVIITRLGDQEGMSSPERMGYKGSGVR